MIQQVVHTARWVPGAWRGWLRYQTAHTRGEVGKNISSAHRNKERGTTEDGDAQEGQRPVIISTFLMKVEAERNTSIRPLPVLKGAICNITSPPGVAVLLKTDANATEAKPSIASALQSKVTRLVC